MVRVVPVFVSGEFPPPRKEGVFTVFQYIFPEKTVAVPVSVQNNGKRFRRFRFRVIGSWEKRFRTVPVPGFRFGSWATLKGNVRRKTTTFAGK